MSYISFSVAKMVDVAAKNGFVPSKKPIPSAQRVPLPNSKQSNQASSDRGLPQPSPKPRPPQVKPKPNHKLYRGSPNHKQLPVSQNNHDHLHQSHLNSKVNSAADRRSPISRQSSPIPLKHKSPSPTPHTVNDNHNAQASLSVILRLQKITQNDNRKISFPMPSIRPDLRKSRSKELEDLRAEFMMTNLDKRPRSTSPIPLAARENGGIYQNGRFAEIECTDDDDGYEYIEDSDKEMSPQRQVSNIYEELSDVINQRNSLTSNVSEEEEEEYVYQAGCRGEAASTSDNIANDIAYANFSMENIYANSPMENIYVNSPMESLYSNSPWPLEDSLNIYTNSPLSLTKEHDSTSVSSFENSYPPTRSPPKKVQLTRGSDNEVAKNTLFTSSTGSDVPQYGHSQSVPNFFASKSPVNDSLISELQVGGLSLESPVLHRISSIQSAPRFIPEEPPKNKKVSWFGAKIGPVATCFSLL